MRTHIRVTHLDALGVPQTGASTAVPTDRIPQVPLQSPAPQADTAPAAEAPALPRADTLLRHTA